MGRSKGSAPAAAPAPAMKNDPRRAPLSQPRGGSFVKMVPRVVTALIAMFQFLEAGLLLVVPEIYATALGLDGVVLARVIGVMNVMLGVACAYAVLRPHSARAIRACALGFHAACGGVFGWDVAVDSGVALSSFGFMMLVHITCAMWLFAMMLGRE